MKKARMIPRVDPMALGRNLRRLRADRGITVAELQQELEYFVTSVAAVYRWERGEVIPQLETLLALSLYYGITLDELIPVELIAC